MSRAQQAKDKIEALDSPTLHELEVATHEFPARDLANVALDEALNASSGPGGTPALADVLSEGNDADGTTITGLPEPENDSEAATKKYVDDNAGGGGSQSVKHIVFPFAFDTPNLVDGVDVWTPAIGDLLYDAWISVITAWDANPALGDIATAAGFAYEEAGYWSYLASDAWAMDTADVGGSFPEFVQPGGNAKNHFFAPRSDDNISRLQQPFRYIEDDPLQLIVSTTGAPGGDPTGASQGEAELHLLVLTTAA